MLLSPQMPLHNSKPDAQAILGNDGDYILQLKDERRHSYQHALSKAEDTPLLPTKNKLTANMAESMSVK